VRSAEGAYRTTHSVRAGPCFSVWRKFRRDRRRGGDDARVARDILNRAPYEGVPQ